MENIPLRDPPGYGGTLEEILLNLKTLRAEQAHLSAAVDAISGQVNVLQVSAQAQRPAAASPGSEFWSSSMKRASDAFGATTRADQSPGRSESPGSRSPHRLRTASLASKITLTSYPGQSGVDPLPLNWGNPDPSIRGPIVVGRSQNTLRKRNGENVHFLHSSVNKYSLLGAAILCSLG